MSAYGPTIVILRNSPHQKAQGPDQAREGVARLAVPHLYRRQLYGGGANASFGARWRTANARNLREDKAAHVTGWKNSFFELHKSARKAVT